LRPLAAHLAAARGTAWSRRIFRTRVADDEHPEGRLGGPPPRGLLVAAELFTGHGIDLAQLSPEHYDARFHAGVRELIGVAHAHLRNALSFTLLIPGEEPGIRRFCLWAIGLAVLTLRNIERTPQFTAGSQVKVSRAAVGHDAHNHESGGA